MSENFLGTGWAFPVLPDPAGGLRYAVGEDSIRDCLLALLQTAVGERVMRPDFGTDASTLVFAPGSPANLRQLESSISNAVRAFEPRVELDGVVAEPTPSRPTAGSWCRSPTGSGEPTPRPTWCSRTTSTPWAGEPDDPGARFRLDDLTWDNMVAAIRRRIPAESAGNWTLHARADPGITLLELFAWLAEQRLLSLDQVPDGFVVAVLKLLGLDGPRPAGAGRHGVADRRG